jgi:hypothetical protein
MSATAERGISAPPEVVFDTAIDPARAGGWLPDPLRTVARPASFELAGDPGDPDPRVMRAEWHAYGTGLAGEWTAVLRVRAEPAGGAAVRLDLDGDALGNAETQLAERSLAALEQEVADKLSAG